VAFIGGSPPDVEVTGGVLVVGGAPRCEGGGACVQGAFVGPISPPGVGVAQGAFVASCAGGRASIGVADEAKRLG
jgi:hypothetical protein